MVDVIKELRNLTKLTKKEKGLNKSISDNFSKQDQFKLYEIARTLLEDEIVHAMALLELENKIQSDVSSDASD